ncbi:cytochrome c3 family protein [Hyphococcus luteus]|uniref:Cytochrome C n=1 Tax=Hyphococcus luteus TaxID=2058213 RepID=A0A2S7K265_9PROT|nr:cytochrome c3 family protein [Marinicaulis flavus]PQA86551.1 cytochrome C [Marinicaulis flavus]
MSSRFIYISAVALAVVVGALFAAPPASAQSVIEKLVSPGPVSAAHKGQEKTCNACHASFDKGAQSGLCLDCHEDVAGDVSKHSGFHGKSPDVDGKPCKACHTEHKGAAFQIVSFDRRAFDHGLTDYVLKGAHRDVECGECHAGKKKFRDAAHDCATCHKADEPHKGRLGDDCQSCHRETDWKEISYDHSKTDFPLVGEHRGAKCRACHVEEVYDGLPSLCIDCHKEDDVHKGAFGTDCETCHQPAGWGAIAFDHGRRTGFSLTGKHAPLACKTCHTQTLFEPKLKQGCVSCHRSDDVHEGRNGPDCASCHRTSSWTASRFNHDRDTTFALMGAHRRVDCKSCHLKPVTVALPGKECVDCHQSDDPHKGAQGEDCASCHNVTSWVENTQFDHDLSRFPLLGRHKDVKCAACHKSKVFSDAPMACRSCHADEDKHGGALGADCGLCHSPAKWSHWLFDHERQTTFALTGSHKGLICSTCHKPNGWSAGDQSSECVACHRVDDKHRGQYGGDCGRCHTTQSFDSVKMN